MRRNERISATGTSIRAIATLLALVPSLSAATSLGGAFPLLPTDAVLAQLIDQSVAARPELHQAEASLRAERERIPQAGALPDPVLTLGIHPPPEARPSKALRRRR